MMFRIKTVLLSLTPPLSGTLGYGLILKEFSTHLSAGESIVFKGNSGKLVVYTSTGLPSKKRLESVRDPVKETAKLLNLDFEIVRFDRSSFPIHVYYEEGEGHEPIPLYCDEGKISDLEEISNVLRNMMFVPSFHPKHSVLREIRSKLFKLS